MFQNKYTCAYKNWDLFLKKNRNETRVFFIFARFLCLVLRRVLLFLSFTILNLITEWVLRQFTLNL